MASALGHNVPRIFTLVFAAGTALAGLAGVIGGNYQVTEPAIALPQWGRSFSSWWCSVASARSPGCFIASILAGPHPDLCRRLRRIAGRSAGEGRHHRHRRDALAEVLNVTLPQIGALLPFLMMVLILVFRPRGLMGTRDT